MAMLIVILTR